MLLTTGVELHGPAQIANEFEDWVLTTTLFLGLIKRGPGSQPERYGDDLHELLEKIETRLYEVREAAREALDYPTGRRAYRPRSTSGWLRQ
ncbi:MULTISPECIES: hypothetical protein [Streptomyces violaceusniger group]|uniref:Uncharacterized protein n=1 Tax=Streptomyces malaysiensis TaxID=92644 RepID=A0A2J7ZDQ1_STRMQ|nr:hypothetical protein [Streptomyces malaysiensis]PNG98402.1 hypothetical protein SMF913_14427 [Streptomyces malaysiensis]